MKELLVFFTIVAVMIFVEEFKTEGETGSSLLAHEVGPGPTLVSNNSI